MSNNQNIGLPNYCNNISDAFIAVDNNLQIVYINSKAANLFYNHIDNPIGSQLSDFFSKDEYSFFYKAFLKALKMQELTVLDEYMNRDASCFQVRIYPSANGLSILIIDITQQKKSEEKIIESELRFRTLTKNAPVGIFETDVNGYTTYVNQTWLNYTGLSFQEAMGDNWMRIIHPEDRELQVTSWQTKTRNIEPSQTEYRIINNKGELRWMNGKAVPVINSAGKVTGYIGTITDVTDLKTALELLNERSGQLAELSTHLQNIRENERMNIAREIHDELGQQLTALKMDIAWLNRRMSVEDHVVKHKFEDAIKLIDETVKSIRRIATELRPSLLDDLGLNAAIEWEVKEFNERSGVKINFIKLEDDANINPLISIGLFRILQESLTNIARHSLAKQAMISLIKTNNVLRLCIQDDGIGFTTSEPKRIQTFGLLGIKERATMLNGESSVTSVPGKGTIIDVRVPLQ